MTEAAATTQAPEQTTAAAPAQTTETATASAAAATAQTTQQTAPATGAATAADWRASITDEALRNHAGRFTTAADLAKAHLDLRQKLSSAIVPPKDGAPPEEVAAFRKALGVPEKPDDYKLPDASAFTDTGKAMLSAIVGKMHEAGATQAHIDAVVPTYLAMAQEHEAQLAADAQRAVEAGITTLKREWGGDFDANVEAAKRGVAQFGGDGFKQFLDTATVDGVPLGSHPAFIRAFAEIGRRMGEDGFQAGGLSGDAANSAQERINALKADQNKALARGDTATAQRLDQQISAEFTKLYGDAPIR